jgi:hypothetical protein
MPESNKQVEISKVHATNMHLTHNTWRLVKHVFKEYTAYAVDNLCVYKLLWINDYKYHLFTEMKIIPVRKYARTCARLPVC